MFRKPPHREPVKADPYQIERWVEIARKNLDEKLRFREVTMHMRHANERLDHKGNVTDIRHGTEKLDLARRKEENMRRLHDAVVKARTTGIIPDKSLAPTHTSEEIAEWAREKHHELSEQHENQWTDLAGQLIKTDFEDHTNWLNHNRDMLKEAQQAEQAVLVKTLALAFESGRIPGMEPPEYQIDRLRGRE
jgi:hypothetical protein